jgi:hypothetical protein
MLVPHSNISVFDSLHSCITFSRVSDSMGLRSMGGWINSGRIRGPPLAGDYGLFYTYA